MTRLASRLLVPFEYKSTHVKPALIQVCLLSYWALHWEPLRSRLMALLWLIPAAMLVDLLLVRRLHRVTRLSTAAIPVTFSAMLYTNYPLEQSFWMGLVVLVSLLSKALIRRRGKHVFNPSTGAHTVGLFDLLGVAPLQDVARRSAPLPIWLNSSLSSRSSRSSASPSSW